MASVRPMVASDLFKLSTCNLDHLTETYGVNFYLDYLTKWPELCRVLEGQDGQIEGYILGKLEASPYPPPHPPYDPSTNPNPNYLPWHGHITALTVAPGARRLRYATKLTESLERQSEAAEAWFVDLFVREENRSAQELYRKMGYSVYRRVVGYYNDDADAFDMRKPLSRDKGQKHVRANGENIHVDPSEVW
ncbi:acyl-CoA N-acyltransferase [Eremomyces bilateralis CBS 781.70]|uniref:Acyl-CoA N-acyltransferase n=1 Tax=Eremomyces bilateralis CBS 781.70 TaxID=1392243 RepID=A0A6G1GD17_9PEZI|nr:acyl-CoA N-acyltransferase [Eremomyces bilateralis CBS 781.70]KAF1815791.1 acyl-CoA N-acyltransferase [Eremomyces bilateralis CBS 781.70]